jgi:hypothetical protein
MPTMIPTTHLDVIDAVDHMPVGSTLVVNDFSWDEYEALMREFEERGNPRFCYDSGSCRSEKCLLLVKPTGR